MSLTKVENALIYVSSEHVNAFAPLPAETIAPLPAETLKICTPFYISVMMFNPEAGYKYFVKVQKSCSADNDPIWKLRFDLDRLIKNKFVRVLEIEVGAGTDGEEKKIEQIAEEGITDKQSDAINTEVYPLAKVLAEEDRDPTEAEAQAINNSMRKVIIIN
jgi:hypothetical protein